MHQDERQMITEQLSELFGIADELRRRIDELAELVAHPAQPARVVQLTSWRRPTPTSEYNRVIEALRAEGHLAMQSDPE